MGLWSRLKRTVNPGSHHDEIQEELDFHLHMDIAGGAEGREARVRLGNLTRIEEDTRAMGILEWLDSALQDVRYGMRQLRKTPVLVAAVVLSVAIGIGANTTIFSLIDAALLRPVPVPDPGSLRIVEWNNAGGFPSWINNINGEFIWLAGGRAKGSSVSARICRELARRQNVAAAIVGVADPDTAALAGKAFPAEQIGIQYVSSNFFEGLGVRPQLGRPFRDDEDRTGQEPVVVVSHRFWMSHFEGASPEDAYIRINNVPAHIVGVAPARFFGLYPGKWTDVYAPLAARVAFQTQAEDLALRGEDDLDWWVRIMVRLKPGVTEAATLAQLNLLFRSVAVPVGLTVEPGKIPNLISRDGALGFGQLSREERTALWILMLLVGVLLLIVCANVANLLLARSVGRQRESAIRLAIGASRWRLVRQFLIESTLLAILGSGTGIALGCLFAQWLQRVFLGGGDPSSAFDLNLNFRLLAWGGALCALTAFLFGLAPAVRAAWTGVGNALKSQARPVIAGRLRLPRLLVSLQVALCFTALFAAGLLARSLTNLRASDIGFDRENLAYVSVNPSQAGYSAERIAEYHHRLRDELGRLPGVLRVGAAGVRPLSGNGNMATVKLPGEPSKAKQQWANINEVDENFFGVLRITLVAGRTFERGDFGPASNAAVVDELFAKRFFAGQNPIGRPFGVGLSKITREIVGVVRSSSYKRLRGEPDPTVYLPYHPEAARGNMNFAIRSAIDSSQLAAAVRKTAADIDPAVPVTAFFTQNGLIDRLLHTERLLAYLSGAFSFAALALAAVGIGGLLAYAVASRTGEIGVRMALGAAAGDMVRMVLRDALWMAGVGIVAGLPCAYAVGRVLKTALFHLQPIDPATTAMSLAILLAISLLAAWLPARRAATIDPMKALREE